MALGATMIAAAVFGAPGADAQDGVRDDSLFGGGPPSCRDAMTGVRRMGVAGGADARLADFPFMVEVRVGGALCGGSLIAPGFVLTAAHCVVPNQCAGELAPGRCPTADPFDVRVTRPDLSGRARGDRRGVQRIFAHPDFRHPAPGVAQPLDADVAVLVLDRPFPLEEGEAVNVADPMIDLTFAQGGACATVAGWGRTDVLDRDMNIVAAGPETDVLQSLDLAIVDAGRCAQLYPGDITDNMLCAGDGREGFNTCSGDSGGPLIIDVGGPIQVGVVSWAYGCAQAEEYTVFTRIGAPAVRGWIDEVILGR